jgi:hypothetical protein
MPRINPTVTDEAEKIYDKLEHHVRGRFVSDAIIEKHSRDTGTSLEQRVAELEKTVSILKGQIIEIKRQIR